jgi:hypothetical protein
VAPPTVYANDKLDGVTVRLIGLATINVTATVCGLFEAPLDVTVTLPV